MENSEIFTHIDHTLLNPAATSKQIAALCREALEYHTASVCIPPCFIRRARKNFPELNICTVIGFPLGYSTTNVKWFETKDAIECGANEIDMVVNQTDVKNGRFSLIEREIALIKEACEFNILKVIVETCNLTEQEKVEMCRVVTSAGADYIKTSTGFGSAGADIRDVELFRKNIGDDVKIKAAGGIKTKEQIEMFLNAGCDRIGTSSAVKLLIEGD